MDNNVAALSFEDAIKELEQIVKRLESGQASLEDSIQFYTRGTLLKNHCETKLQQAKMKVEMIIKGSDGKIELQPFENAE